MKFEATRASWIVRCLCWCNVAMWVNERVFRGVYLYENINKNYLSKNCLLGNTNNIITFQELRKSIAWVLPENVVGLHILLKCSYWMCSLSVVTAAETELGSIGSLNSYPTSFLYNHFILTNTCRSRTRNSAVVNR